MSGIAKAVKKVWRPIEKLNSKLVNIGTLGLHNKTKKFRHKIIKSKVFKVVVAAAAIYFGGAALLSLANGGTAMAGIGSAWSGVSGAGSALMSGNLSAAGSSLSAGWSGAATGAGSFAGGQAATSAIASSAAAPAASTVATSAATSSGVGASTPQLAAMHPAAASASMTPVATEAAAGSGGLLSGAWKGLGEAGKAAVITSGINMGGQMLQGQAAEKQSEDIRKRRTFWGVDGEGQGDASSQQVGGLLQLAQTTPMSSFKPGNAPWNAQPQSQYVPQAQQQPQTLDELIKMMG